MHKNGEYNVTAAIKKSQQIIAILFNLFALMHSK